MTAHGFSFSQNRTCQLKSLTKPYLIIQGHEDEYGSALDAQMHEFSDMVRIESIYSNHDCDNLSQLDCDNITMMIAAFLDWHKPDNDAGHRLERIFSAPCSAIITVGAWILLPVIVGMIDESMMRSRFTPCTFKSASTTAMESEPMRQLPTV